MNQKSKYLSLGFCLLLFVSSSVKANNKLRVCADPDNLPFSNQKQEGFENKIAQVLAKDMHATLEYTWLKQRQSFIRQTLGAERCDVVIGVPRNYDRVLTTLPYYRSSYVMVFQTKRKFEIKSYDDPLLRELKVGLHAIGNDGSNSPPATAMGRHDLAKNIVGFSMWGDSTIKNPQGLIVDAVAEGKIDLAIVWGPFGGYFAKKYGHQLTVTPAPTDAGMPSMLFAYDISMGVRKGETKLVEKLESSILRNRQVIQKILSTYHIPLITPFSELSETKFNNSSTELLS